MCFHNDYDWYAQVSDTVDGPSAKDASCCECGVAVRAGEHCRTIDQQEFDCCQICDPDGEDYDPEHSPHECEFGETFHAVICDSCCKILKAIETVEKEEGCPVDAQQPMIGELWEAMSYERYKYAGKALEMFPELAGNEMLQEVEE